MATVKKGNKLFVLENCREIDLIDDFFTVRSECAESYQYLVSLKIQLKNLPWHKEFNSPEIIEGYLSTINVIENSFISLEEKLIKVADVVEDEVVPVTERYEFDCIEMIDTIKRYIELKSKIDNIQLEIIKYMINNLTILSDKFAIEKPLLASIHLNSRVSIGMSMAFTHSKDEDKVVTFCLTCREKEVLKELKKAGIDLPMLKIRDYTFELNKKRNEFRQLYEELIHLMSLLPQIELNEKQASYSKQVTILTWLIFFLTFFMLAQGIISFYYDFTQKERPIFVQVYESYPKPNLEKINSSSIETVKTKIYKK